MGNLTCCNRPAIKSAQTNGFRVCQYHFSIVYPDNPNILWDTVKSGRCDFRITSYYKERQDYRRPSGV